MHLTDVMATQVVSVSPDTMIGDAARRMVEVDIGAAVVIDESGVLVGVITERDLMRCVSEGTDPSMPVEQRETVGALQRGERVGDAMAIGIGLDHRPDARARRGLARDFEIGGEGVAMNDRFDRPRHGGILPAVCRYASPRRADPENPRAINPAAGRQSGVSSDVR
jgi:CBS domain-containing protein